MKNLILSLKIYWGQLKLNTVNMKHKEIYQLIKNKASDEEIIKVIDSMSLQTLNKELNHYEIDYPMKKTIISELINDNRYECLKYTINKGAKINLFLADFCSLISFNKAFTEEKANEKYELIEFLVKNKLNLNAEDRHNKGEFKYYIQALVNLNNPINNENTKLIYNFRLKILNLFISHGAKLPETQGHTLVFAVNSQYQPFIDCLMNFKEMNKDYIQSSLRYELERHKVKYPNNNYKMLETLLEKFTLESTMASSFHLPKIKKQKI